MATRRNFESLEDRRERLLSLATSSEINTEDHNRSSCKASIDQALMYMGSWDDGEDTNRIVGLAFSVEDPTVRARGNNGSL